MKLSNWGGLRNKGFTLIELLAVIVILAVIALISVPIVLNMIENARKSAFSDTAYGLLESAKVTYVENLLDGKSEVTTYVYPFDTLKFSGSKPSGGVIRIDPEGNTEIAIHNGTWCAKKTKENNKVEIINYEESTCKLESDDVPSQQYKTFTEVMESTHSEVSSLDPEHNLRYVGVDPNNYVGFNNELWRVIGVFDGQVKLIRDEPYSTSISWDQTEENGGHGTYGLNNWSISTLQVELNTTFLNHIDQISKSYIDQSYLWLLGGWAVADITRSEMYIYERGTTVYSGMPTEWTGAIGLMYPSDYAYATSSTESYCDIAILYHWGQTAYSDCKNQDWLYDSSNSQWTMTPYSDEDNYLFGIGTEGIVGGWRASISYQVKPTLYLKNNVKIKSGVGTKEKPFELIMS